ncbi:carbonic anhydrase 4-like [Alligator mississippiensis]|uniref:carbonic anhydrase 4-like n=1 Tax=Alligator mississippiensis TaxID=8496 RepID=UPI000711B23B|nr:carbonic anhydrase 4-like [Alligator mississippiensis]
MDTALRLLALLLLGGAVAPHKESWCYEDPECGPATWVKLGHCNGTRQSPVELSTHDAVPDPRLGPVALSGYGDARRLRSLHNTGHTVEVQLAEGLMLSGPGLPGHYRAQSFHLHWGQGEARPGSEHLLDGRRFSMELHVVHTKENLTLHEAMDDPEGVAVLAFFVQASSHARPTRHWEAFVNQLKHVEKKGEREELDGMFSLGGLMEAVNLGRYFRYHGSLTTPNCNEVVIWTVFAEPIMVPPGVVTAFPSTLHATDSKHGPRLQNNFRPVQSLGGRQVKVSSALHSHASPAPTWLAPPLLLLPLLLGSWP